MDERLTAEERQGLRDQVERAVRIVASKDPQHPADLVGPTIASGTLLRLLDERDALEARAELAEGSVADLCAERQRLLKALEQETEECNGLLDRLAEVAPSDDAMAERSIRASGDGEAWCVTIESSPSFFLVIYRCRTEAEAQELAEMARVPLAQIIADSTAQVRRELDAQGARAKLAEGNVDELRAERRRLVAEVERLRAEVAQAIPPDQRRLDEDLAAHRPDVQAICDALVEQIDAPVANTVDWMRANAGGEEGGGGG